MDEAEYLFSSPANTERLQRSTEKVKQSVTQEHDLPAEIDSQTDES